MVPTCERHLTSSYFSTGPVSVFYVNSCPSFAVKTFHFFGCRKSLSLCKSQYCIFNPRRPQLKPFDRQGLENSLREHTSCVEYLFDQANLSTSSATIASTAILVSLVLQENLAAQVHEVTRRHIFRLSFRRSPGCHGPEGCIFQSIPVTLKQKQCATIKLARWKSVNRVSV